MAVFDSNTNIYIEPALPYEILERGQTFSHVFGLNTSLFEQFVLTRNIMGPCWLKVEEPNFSNVKNVSLIMIRYEVQVFTRFRHLGVKLKPMWRSHH